MISSTARAGSRASASRWSRIRRCTVTSSALVGSSAMSSSRVGGDRDRDERPLAHAAGELVRVLPRPHRRLGTARPGPAARRRARRRSRRSGQPVHPQRLGDLRADPLHRVQRHRRVLRDEADRGAPRTRAAASRTAPARSSPAEADAPGVDACRRPAAARRRRARWWTCPTPTPPPRRRPRRRRRRGPPRATADTAAGAVARRRPARPRPRSVGVAHGSLAHSPSSARAIRLTDSTVAGDRQPGHRAQPPRGGQVVAALGDERPPLRRRRRGAVAEEAQRRDRQDRRRRTPARRAPAPGRRRWAARAGRATAYQRVPERAGGLDVDGAAGSAASPPASRGRSSRRWRCRPRSPP